LRMEDEIGTTMSAMAVMRMEACAGEKTARALA